jgi:PASTA domain
MLDTTNLVLSLVILKQRKVDSSKALAASVGAALISGPSGLLIPAIVAAGTSRPKPGLPPPPDDTGVVKVRVPNVVGQPEAAAIRIVRDADLTPVTSATFSAPENDVGTVVDQDPAGDQYARSGSSVDLTIAHAPEEEERSESEKEDEILRVVNKIADQVGVGLAQQRRRTRSPEQSSGSGSTT